MNAYHSVPQGEPSVAVCVPVFNKIELTRRFLRSFAAVTYSNYTMVIIDDGSSDGTGAAISAEYPYVVVLSGDGNLWWTGGTNLGVRYALAHDFDFVLTINNDAIVAPDFLSLLVGTAKATPLSIVGSRLNVLQNPTQVWCMGGVMDWHTGRILKLRENATDELEAVRRNPNPMPVPILTGCGTLVPVACFRAIGEYSARWYPQYHADSEFVLRAAQNGYQILCETSAVVWNDIVHTTQYTNRLDAIFSRRSFYYWRPMFAIHFQYCPRRHLIASLFTQYHWLIPRPKLVHLKRACTYVATTLRNGRRAARDALTRRHR